MAGYCNKILRVNLTNQTSSEETLDPKMCLDFLGGRGFGIKMFYDEVAPGVDPLGPDNKLMFFAGPLAGTQAQSFGRWKVFFKSPLTGGHFRSSGGGHFAAEMKFAGYDGIIIEGKSEKPVYLWIKDGKCRFRDADYLVGLNCSDTHTLIREELKDMRIRVACTGPAGDNLVKYAGIFSDRRTAARGGGGAVMGAKNLKAIAIRGENKVDLASPEAFREAVKTQMQTYRESPSFHTLPNRGTQDPEMTLSIGMFPAKNFQEGFIPHWERIEGFNFVPWRQRPYACHNCMIHCGQLTKVRAGSAYVGHWSEGPEYETIWGFTGSMMVDDVGLTVAADHLCDELGIDTISAAVTIGMAYEMYEKGLITKKDTDGLELVWGKHEPVLPLLNMIACRRGIGDLLAEGTRIISQRIGQGTDYYAIHVKGLELPGYDPRGAKAHGLNLMTQSIGADHNSGYAPQEIFGMPYQGKVLDRFATEGKGALAKHNQDITAIHDSCILCAFPSILFFAGNFKMLSDLLVSATGIQEFADEDYLCAIGERIFNLERMYNVRDGFGRKDDVMPGRITQQPLPAGPSAGSMFEAEELLDDYYQVRGWDPLTGIPSADKLRSLGLDYAIQ